MLEEKACEWLDNYERLLHIGPISHKAFYFKQKGNITHDEYDKFVQDFSERGCKMMMDWLKVYNKAGIYLFIKAIDKTSNTIQTKSKCSRMLLAFQAYRLRVLLTNHSK